jgi:murein DD-endopeptidase MepM/ murein hydrolase activator NlpD
VTPLVKVSLTVLSGALAAVALAAARGGDERASPVSRAAVGYPAGERAGDAPLALARYAAGERAGQPPTGRAAAVVLEVTWSPASPRQGTLFKVSARTTGTRSTPTGAFGGEPLHFEPDSAGGWWALAAVSVDAAGAGELIVQVGSGDAREEARMEVPIAPGRYAMDRLTVAPEFTEPPEPALAARMERESARAMEVARGAHETPRMWTPGGVVRPRSSRITSGFGNGREFNGEVQSRHMGTDFAGAVGEPVLAAADGIVRIVDQFYLGGRVIYIDHGGGLSSAYLHLSAASVAAGDRVRAGQRIGSVGATGRVTGPHLHWIVRYGGITVDPLSLLEVTTP